MTDVKQDRKLSTGDAVAIVALLLFTVGWVALWMLAGELDSAADDKGEKLSGSAAFMLLAILAGPPLWAGYLVHRIVDRAA